MTNLKCPSCDDISRRFEFANTLHVHFTEDSFLSSILRDATFAGNWITGRHCEKCNTRQNVHQTVRIESTPDVLVVELVRFANNNTKNMKKVKFGKRLNLTPFTIKKMPAHYGLTCVVQHRGDLKGGHYRAIASNPHGKWVKLDDSVVSPALLKNALNHDGDWTPYVLFYQRVDLHGAETA